MKAGGVEMENFSYFIIGAFITLLVGIFFYVRSSQELKHEAEKLREEAQQLRFLQELTIYALTNPNANIQPKRDEAGNVVGVIATAAGVSAGKTNMRGVMTLVTGRSDETSDR
jgi:hypothetical protein